jgi:hypothetical protein
MAGPQSRRVFVFLLLPISAVYLSTSGVYSRPLTSLDTVLKGESAGERALLQIPPGNFQLLLGVYGFLDKYGTGKVKGKDDLENWGVTLQLYKGM